MGLKCPCKGCTDRTITCHGVCLKYKDWQIYDRAVKEDLKERNSQRFCEYAIRASWEKLRRKKRGWG